MTDFELKYKKNVWEFLDKLKPGTRLVVAKQYTPQYKELFLNSLHEYMAALPYQGFLSFNKNFSEVYKTHSVP